MNKDNKDKKESVKEMSGKRGNWTLCSDGVPYEPETRGYRQPRRNGQGEC